MKAFLILFALWSVTFAGTIEYGPQLGYWVPTGVGGTAGDQFTGNIFLAGQMLYHLPQIAIEGSLGYVPLKPKVGSSFTGHIIPLCAGIRGYNGPFYLAGGLEYDFTQINWDFITLQGGRYIGTDSYKDLSGYFGVGIVPNIPFPADIDASIRLHYVDFSDLWAGLTVGINF